MAAVLGTRPSDAGLAPVEPEVTVTSVPKVGPQEALAVGGEIKLVVGLANSGNVPVTIMVANTHAKNADVARAAEMDQSEISRVEQRDDLKLSTLRRYARAFDADIEATPS